MRNQGDARGDCTRRSLEPGTDGAVYDFPLWYKRAFSWRDIAEVVRPGGLYILGWAVVNGGPALSRNHWQVSSEGL